MYISASLDLLRNPNKRQEPCFHFSGFSVLPSSFLFSPLSHAQVPVALVTNQRRVGAPGPAPGSLVTFYAPALGSREGWAAGGLPSGKIFPEVKWEARETELGEQPPM